MKTIILAVTSVFFLAMSQVLWKMGTNQAGTELTIVNLLPAAMKLLTNVWFVVGCILALLSSVLWFAALSTAELSKIFPYYGLSFVFVFILSWLMLKEPINSMKLAGMLVISLGIFAGLILIAKGS